MSNFNQVILEGNITKDCDVSQTEQGLKLCTFSLAVNKTIKRDGKEIEEVSFFDLAVFEKAADLYAPLLTKGAWVLIFGELKQDRWEFEGKIRTKVAISVQSIKILKSKSEENV